MVKLTLLSAPVEEPVSIAEAQSFLRVDNDDEVSTILRQIRVARQMAEHYTGRQFCEASWRLSLDDFPRRSGLRLGADGVYASGSVLVPRPPLREISAIKYLDPDGVDTELTAAHYLVETAEGELGRVLPVWGEAWPSVRVGPGAVRIEFSAGYGTAADVPECAREAILMMLAARYDQRSAVVLPPAGPPVMVPGGWRELLGPLKVAEAG